MNNCKCGKPAIWGGEQCRECVLTNVGGWQDPTECDRDCKQILESCEVSEVADPREQWKHLFGGFLNGKAEFEFGATINIRKGVGGFTEVTIHNQDFTKKALLDAAKFFKELAGVTPEMS